VQASNPGRVVREGDTALGEVVLQDQAHQPAAAERGGWASHAPALQDLDGMRALDLVEEDEVDLVQRLRNLALNCFGDDHEIHFEIS
jgi:hypothetical protein